MAYVYFHKSVAILITVMLLVMTGCSFFSSPTPTIVPTPTQTRTPTPTPIPPLAVKTVCLNIGGKPLTDCDLVVEINNTLNTDLQLEVVVQADQGVFFLPSSDIVLSTDRRQASTHYLMGPGESRIPSFSYRVDKNTLYSGEYVISIGIFQISGITGDEPLFEEKKKIFIKVNLDGPQFLPTQTEFNELFSNSYVNGNVDNLSYFIELSDGERPTKGKLFVKVISEKDGYMPQVMVNVNPGAILFNFPDQSRLGQLNKSLNAAQPVGIINVFESKILVFPFQIDPNSRDGGYFITVTLKDSKNEITDKVPYRIRVSSTSAKSWLSLEEERISSPTATSTSAPRPSYTPTQTPIPTQPPLITPSASTSLETSTCLIPDASCIFFPEVNAKVKGVVQILGSADRENFDYYKFEYQSEENENWNFLDRFDQPVKNGVLMDFDTKIVPSGVYLLRLIVVDRTGNFYPKEQQPVLRVIVEN